MSQKKSPALAQVLQRLVLLRLFLPLVALSVIVIGGVGYLGEQTLESQQRQKAQFMARIVDRYLDQAARTLDAVAQVAEVSPPEDLVTFMQGAWEAYGYFDTLYYLDASSKIKLLAPPDPRYQGLDMSNLPYLEQTGEKKNLAISRPFISLRTGNPTVYVVRQLSRKSRVVGELSLESLQDEITRGRGASQDVIFIMDQSGLLLAHPSSNLVKQQTNQSYLEIFRRGLGGDATLVYEYAGTMVLGSAARVERTGWVVVDQVPVSVSLRPYAWALGLTLLASLAIWLALAWSLRNQLEQRVAVPLAQLSRGTGALANGDFSQGKALAFFPAAFAELTMLATDFQNMSDAFEARQVALQESEERHRRLFERMPVALFRSTPAGQHLDANLAHVRMLGYPDREALLTINAADLYVNAEDRQRWRTMAERDGVVRNFEVKLRRRDGTIIWGRITSRAIRDSGGQVLCYEGSVEDITERKRAEEALRESEKRVRRKLDAVLCPEADISALELSDIIDSEKVQKLMDKFYRLTNVGIGIIDLHGNVLVGTGWQDICTKFHRVNPESCRLCIESDLELSRNVPVGTFKQYRCKNLMWDIATPIMLGDKHVGNIFLGQFLFDDETPDYKAFRQQAHRYGFNEEEYLAALDRVPRWSHQKVDAAMSFYTAFAGMIGNLSYANIKLATALEERRKAEETLRESEKRFRDLYENAPNAYFSVGTDGLIRRCNRRAGELLGYALEELVGRPVMTLYADTAHGKEKAEEIIQRFRAGETVRDEELEMQKADGNPVWISLTVDAVRDAQGRVVESRSMIIDVTERKRAEDELKRHRGHLEDLVRERTAELTVAKEAAETANRAKSAFLANMSHELRTPLNAILGYAQLLQRRPLEPDVIANLHTVQKSGEHLLTLITDILDLSKIEAGRMELHPVPIHFPNFLDHVASIVRSRAEAKDLTFSFERLSALPVGVQADETRLRQVLLNLLDNAVKFTDAGQVTLRVSAISTRAPQRRTACWAGVAGSARDTQYPTPNLRFEVQDTGVGIPPDQLERVFEPFEQAKDLTHRTKGTGLGLTVSRQLVRLMGSELYVQSEPGRGSAFWFEVALPVAEVVAEVARPPEQVITGYQGPRRTVLVVDDVPSNRAVLVDMLEPLEFDVAEAANGQQAIHLARALRPDLILIDRWMPVLDGFEAARRMQQMPELRETPIIAVSASVSQEDQAQSREAGINAFLSKPVSWPNLAALLEEHLKLEWEYERKGHKERQEYEKEAVLVPPPQEELAVLRDLARRGDMGAIRERAAHVATLGEQYVPFARKLRKLAKSFEEKQIRTLIERYMDEDQ